MIGPCISTARLTLRPYRIDDFADSLAMWGDPAVTRFIGGKASTPAEVWGRMQRYAGMWTLHGYGYWAIEESATSRYVGDVGFGNYRRAIDPPIDDPEIGWAFLPAYHGRGYATESVLAALAWSDAHLRDTRTICIIDPANAASIRVAQKCGYGVPQPTTYLGKPVLLYARLVPTSV